MRWKGAHQIAAGVDTPLFAGLVCCVEQSLPESRIGELLDHPWAEGEWGGVDSKK